ncbi:hypothetical protein DICPUDRAFT_84316 [Dictyostelium purpureum]|uniref:Uncharacterized protein n=1 Tax=Dictyostelium purpureum TaxID=5786 RepID=F1A297_DICPU|nr:uncharacterized protein DICPUDRAFT_84316 [Dictyostelium purpureum]EGC29688.1 hypothetical protein DICPUDRAFT_84316 [Dictyostelium purpureum]|eukprot:XP_003293793.1 hypothetical protein DICPUDRAFT_84316 [Dictyostelium purpureum]
MHSKLYENLENDKLNILEDYGYVRGIEYEEEEFYSLDDENTSGQTKFNFETGMKDVDKLQHISQIYYFRRVLTIRQSSCYRSEPRASCQQVFVQQKTFIKHIGLDHTLIVPTEEQKVELVKAQGFEFAKDFHKLNVKSKQLMKSLKSVYDGSHFYKLINPTTTVSSASASIHGHTNKSLAESGAYIIAHNEKFDRGILASQIGKTAASAPSMFPSIVFVDSIPIFKRLLKKCEGGYSMSSLIDH